MAFDAQQQITDSLIAAMESGVAPWRKGWKGGAGSDLPLRHNGVPYKGVNVIMLWLAAATKGYQSPYWMTYKQAAIYGAQVRQGEKASLSYHFTMFDVTDKKTGDKKKIPSHRINFVFNVEQIDGLPERYKAKPIEVMGGAERIDVLESFFAKIGATLHHGESYSPRYIPSLDVIQMPPVESFELASRYYGTLSHEHIHWTGHKSRLNRLETTKAGYAFEELIAELGSCFLVSQIGGELNLELSAAYLQAWLKALKDDKQFIFKAASAAQKAVDMLLTLGGIAAPVEAEE